MHREAEATAKNKKGRLRLRKKKHGWQRKHPSHVISRLITPDGNRRGSRQYCVLHFLGIHCVLHFHRAGVNGNGEWGTGTGTGEQRQS
jgi:hypothetical protein